MSARYGIGRIANSNDYGRLQRKVEDLYDTYNYNSNTSNFLKCSDLIHENTNVQRKLCDSLTDIATEGATSSPGCTQTTTSYYRSQSPVAAAPASTSYRSSRWSTSPCYSDYYSSCHSSSNLAAAPAPAPYTSTTSTTYCTSTNDNGVSAAAEAAAAAAEAALKSERAVYDTLKKKNAEIADISFKFSRELTQLESQLNSAKLDNCDLKAKLDGTKDELLSEKIRSDSRARAARQDIDDLSYKLRSAESKLSCLEPRAELARQLEVDIAGMKAEISRIRAENALLVDTNEIQAKIIKSRSCSPAFGLEPECPQPPARNAREVSFIETVTHRSRSQSPCADQTCETTTVTTRRSVSPPACGFRPAIRSPSYSSCTRTYTTSYISPLSPNHCTQVIRQESLTSRFNDLHTRDRMNAMDLLRHYSNFENNQRIVFAAVQEAFAVAKRTFADWKIRIRSTLAMSHCGPETLEEAVQNYVNKNVDLYDLPYMSAEVVSALNRNPKISLPIGVSFTVISSFIREACRVAWEMSTLAYPLDIAFALDGEVLDECKYRRSFDSDLCALLVNHHVWPCLMQGLRVVAKGEAVTKRELPKWTTTTTTTLTTSSSRCASPLRSCLRARSPSPYRPSSSNLRRSRSTYCVYY